MTTQPRSNNNAWCSIIDWEAGQQAVYGNEPGLNLPKSLTASQTAQAIQQFFQTACRVNIKAAISAGQLIIKVYLTANGIPSLGSPTATYTINPSALAINELSIPASTPYLDIVISEGGSGATITSAVLEATQRAPLGQATHDTQHMINATTPMSVNGGGAGAVWGYTLT